MYMLDKSGLVDCDYNTLYSFTELFKKSHYILCLQEPWEIGK